MKRTLGLGLGCLLFAAALVAAMGIPATAQKAFLGVARNQYNVGERSAKCTLCHELRKGPSRKTLNVFGKAMQADKTMASALGKNSSYVFSADDLAAVGKVLAQLEDQDSDGDGATNKEEFVLGSVPGDPDIKPDPKALDAFRKAAAVAKAAEQKKGEAKK